MNEAEGWSRPETTQKRHYFKVSPSSLAAASTSSNRSPTTIPPPSATARVYNPT